MEIQTINDIIYVMYPDGRTYAASGDNSNCTVSVCPIELTVYGYRPSLAASGSAIGLYGLAIIINLILGFKYKTWGFMVTMILGCLDQILGYVGRILMWQNPWEQAGFIMQIVLITIGPVFFCAAIYVMIYKIINYIDPSVARFNPKIIYWGFIVVDIISLILQAAGGAMSSSSNGDSQAGVDIALAGLGFQVATLTIFCLVCLDYAWRSRDTWRTYKLSMTFKVFSGFLTLSIITIFIRCCFRVYELTEGYSRESEALRDEPMFNALELAMVIIAAYALTAAHPGPVFYAEKGKREAPEEQRKLANEEKIQTVVGPSASDSE